MGISIAKRKISKFTDRGFTLIELLIVIAVLGVLATVVLVAIDPLEQLARSRDAGKKSSVSQLVKAVTAYGVSRGSLPIDGYPAASSMNRIWQQQLVDSGDIKTKVVVNDLPSQCRANGSGSGNSLDMNDGNICYYLFPDANGVLQFSIWTLMESKSEKTRAISYGATCAANTIVYFVYRSSDNSYNYYCNTSPNAAFSHATVVYPID